MTGAGEYVLVRWALMRLLGLVYLVAFLVAKNQNRALLGANGLTPARDWLSRAGRRYGTWRDRLLNVPTIFWLNSSDRAMAAVAWTGVGLSACVLLGYANSLIMLVLWVLYLSLVEVGQVWYGFGWESQLLETGFLAVFLVPLLDGRPFPATAPPTPIIWLFRWLGVRLMLGAGLIKLRGDGCWRKLTCLDYHFETQPIPNPVSRTLHFLPRPVLHAGVLWNHVVELVVPWFCFFPQTVASWAGLLSISFQGFLIASGNLSFLNWVSMVPFIACFDDATLCRWLHLPLPAPAAPPVLGHQVLAWGYTLLVLLLSIRPVLNLVSNRQMMNTSFDPFRLVNTYGAFGSITRVRREIVIEGTRDEDVTEDTVWEAYEFKGKPGDPHRRPPQIAPYHLRLDWLMWFAAMGHPEDQPWIFAFILKLLEGDAACLSLLRKNPFPDAPPRYIRCSLYRYKFAPPSEDAWWERDRLRTWLGPVSLRESRR